MTFSQLTFEDIALLTADKAPPSFFDKGLKTWILARPDDVLAALREPEAGTPSIVDALHASEARFGVSLSNLIAVAAYNPLLNEGPIHAEARRDLAQKLAARRDAILERLPQLVATCLAPLATEASVEVMQQGLVALVDEVAGLLAGLDKAIPFPVLTVTRVFDRLSSIAALKRADEVLGTLRQAIARQNCDASEQSILSLLILGRDSLLASLGASLAAVFQAAQKTGDGALDLSRPFPMTGVAVAERMAACPLSVGQTAIESGERLRLYLQPLSGLKASTLPIFGAGAHACLGRQLALDAWRAIGEYLQPMRRPILRVEVRYARSNIFFMPETLKVDFS